MNGELKGLKAMPLTVYRSADGSDCTNGGITSEASTIYVIHDQGFLDADELDDKLIFVEQIKGGEVSLAPYFQKTHVIGPMFGGNLATSSDSRVRKVYRVHDRYETREQYAQLSM